MQRASHSVRVAFLGQPVDHYRRRAERRASRRVDGQLREEHRTSCRDRRGSRPLVAAAAHPTRSPVLTLMR